jgi:DNA excision repair protein ERCC-4
MTRSRPPAELPPARAVVLIDSREQDPIYPKRMPWEIGSLPTGDYALKALPHLCAVERKSEADFLACVGTERARFDREIIRLRAYPVRALVIESTWQRVEAGGWRSKVTSAAAMGSLIGWAAMGLPVFMVDTHERAGQFIERILYTAARREWRKLRGLLQSTEKK